MLNPPLTRRQLLRGGTAAAASLLLPARFVLRAASAQSPAPVLVVIFQRGAVDALNMVIPYAEPEYYEYRSQIAVPPPGQANGAIDLDGQFALHPALTSLQPMFARSELAIVHACGSPDPTRSHFDAQDYMETGAPGNKRVTDGWLNRYLQVSDPDVNSVFRGVALTGNTPRSLAGPADALALGDLAQLSLGTGGSGAAVRTALAAMYGGRDDLPALLVGEALRAIDLAEQLDPDRYVPANGAVYPNSELGTQLRQIAQTVKAEVGLEVAFADVGGWDTHALEGGSEGTLANLFRDFADSIAALRADLGDRFANVCVLTMSEFGRTLHENGSGGTDHGHGTAMLVAGGTVRGGKVYGRWPGLSESVLFEGRDLAVTTDFRTLLAEIVARHLGYPDVGAVFPGFTYYDASRLGVIG